MKAGLIGEKLGHSLSPLIHERLYRLAGIEGSYELLETPRDPLGALIGSLEAKGFTGVNVTIPYKTEVMKYISSLSDKARAIGSVNTIFFRDGGRYGYNTDYLGLEMLLREAGAKPRGKRAVILGTGGSALCALKLLSDMGADEIITASRSPENADAVFGAVGYDYLDALDTIDVLVNTTPAGMYPDVEGCPVDEAVVKKCGCVADLVYNPAETKLLRLAKENGIPCANGLVMLCAQAVKAQEIWNGRAFGDDVYDLVYEYMKRRVYKTNLVLIGMPGSGKSTIGRLLAERLGMEFADTDAMIESSRGAIPDIFEIEGETAFRSYENEAAEAAAAMRNTVLSTGGGIVLDARNMEALGASGVIAFLDRPLETLLEDTDTSGRPLLAGGREAIERLYCERLHLYKRYADIVPDNSTDIESCIEDIITKLEEL